MSNNNVKIPLNKLSCVKCAHLDVCVIFRTFAQGHKQVFPEETEPAFQTEDLANICKQFCSRTLLQLGTTNEDAEGPT